MKSVWINMIRMLWRSTPKEFYGFVWLDLIINWQIQTDLSKNSKIEIIKEVSINKLSIEIFLQLA